MSAPFEPGPDPGGDPTLPPPAAPAATEISAPCIVHCKGPCGRILYQGGRIGDDAQIEGLPFDDGQELATDYADAACEFEGCPNTTTAVEAAKAQQPEAMAERIRQLETALARLLSQKDVG